MTKSNTANWRRVDPVLWKKFKQAALANDDKVYEAEEKAIKLYLKEG